MLVLAKKGTTSPTSLTYDHALEEAICFGVDRRSGSPPGRTNVLSAFYAKAATEPLVEAEHDTRRAADQ
jgi:hypothetical protein